jgi:hypothetical protein
MPSNLVKTPKDEKLWEKAKDSAAEQGQEDNWAYINGIYQKMQGRKAAAEQLEQSYWDVGQPYNAPENGVGSQMPPARNRWGEIYDIPGISSDQ